MTLEIVTKNDLLDLSEKLDRIIEMLTKVEQPKEWLRSADVKAMLNCSDSTLKNYRNAGRLKYTKIEGTYYYKKDDVENMMHT